MLEKFVENLAREFEIDKLPSENPGTYSLPLEKNVSVEIASAERGGFSLKALFAPAPDDTKEAFFESALLANLMGQGTEGAVLGIDPASNRLTLSRYVDYTIDYKEFRDILEDFINALDFWQNEVRK